MARSECAGCGEMFNSEGAFNKHRTGPFGEADEKGVYKHQRRCLTVAEMAALGMSKNEKDWWIIEPFDDSKAKIAYQSRDS